MKVLQVSTSDSGGGAARAAYRIHCGLVKSHINSRMRVLYSGTGDELVKGGAPRPITSQLVEMLHRRLLVHSNRGWKTDNTTLHTFGQIGAGLVDELNTSKVDLLHLHWISNMLSVAEIGRLKKPIVWTFHDMWPFCGGEHYTSFDDAARFRIGYLSNNRSKGERGPDLNRRTWEAKCRAWGRQKFSIVCPSEWLACCARESIMFAQSQVHVIPNCLDTISIWRPIPRGIARKVLGLPMGKKLILFGADGGVTDPRKGCDLLREGVARVASKKPKEFEFLIFGQSKPDEDFYWPSPVHWLGTLCDDRLLALAYSAADVMVVPSRQDNLPNTAIEAQACGTPVAAFKIGGLPDIVTHRVTGWLAKAFDVSDLAEGILWLVEDKARHANLATAARTKAVERFAESVVAYKYAELYRQVLHNFGHEYLSST